MAIPTKTAFLDDFPLCVQGPPPPKAQILFLLSSRRLWETADSLSISWGKKRLNREFSQRRNRQVTDNKQAWEKAWSPVTAWSPPSQTMVLNHGLHPLRTLVLKSMSAAASLFFSIAWCQGGDFQVLMVLTVWRPWFRTMVLRGWGPCRYRRSCLLWRQLTDN